MAWTPRKTVWTRQPQRLVSLSKTEPTASGVLALASGQYGYSNQERVPLSVAAGTVTIGAPGIAGTGFRFSGGGGNAATMPFAGVLSGSQAFTIEILCAITAAPVLAGMAGLSGGSSSTSRSLIAYTGGASRNIYFWGNGNDLSSGVPWLTDGSLQHVFCVSDGGIGAGGIHPLRFYRGGALIASGTTPFAMSDTTTTTLRIGDTNAGWTSTPTGVIFKAAVYGRALSQIEISALTANPWRQFSKKSTRIFLPAGGGTVIAVPSGTLTLTGFAPTVVTTVNQFVAVPAGTLTLTGFAPTVQNGVNQVVTVPLGTLTLTGFAPTVVSTANQSVTVPLGSLTLTGFAPTVQNGAAQNVVVPLGTLTLTGFAPTVISTANQSIAVPAGSLTLTGFAPTVQNGANQVVTVPLGALTLTGFAPTVVSTANQVVSVPLGTLTLTGYAPVVDGGEPPVFGMLYGNLGAPPQKRKKKKPVPVGKTLREQLEEAFDAAEKPVPVHAPSPAPASAPAPDKRPALLSEVAETAAHEADETPVFEAAESLAESTPNVAGAIHAATAPLYAQLEVLAREVAALRADFDTRVQRQVKARRAAQQRLLLE